MAIFERKAYLDYLVSCEGNGMIKIITGIRRCGKFYFLYTTKNKEKQILLRIENKIEAFCME